MSDNIDIPEEYDFEGEVSLAPDEKNVGGQSNDWLKLTKKGQTIRCAFVYFHTVDANTVRQAVKEAKKKDQKLSREEIKQVASTALKKQAESLDKSVDELTGIEKLDIGTAHFKVMKAHYQEGLGFVLSRLGKDGAEADAVWKRLPEVKTYFTTLLLIYPTDSEGKIINKEALADQIKKGKLDILPWRFSNRIYEDIWKVNDSLRENGMALASQDIKLECKEPQYQNISVSFTGPAVWLKNDQLRQAVLRQAINLYDKLIPFREVTTDQLKAKLGLGGSAAEDVSADNLHDLLDQV
jgi:hypothetical protein